MKANKLVLGTAQLGFNYGIANKTGKPSKNESFNIMKLAAESGISYFDTAYSYGDSEIIIGKFLKTCKEYRDKVNIITKMPALKERIVNEKLINRYFSESLERLNKSSMYCYMIHDFNDIADNSDVISKVFLSFKDAGFIKKIGVSIYNESQIKFLLENFELDLVQLSINIFDQRLVKSDVLCDLRKKGIEIYGRSIFLQGLIFVDEKSLPPSLLGAIPYIKRLGEISSQLGMTKEEIALLFVNSISEIDKIVLGVEKIEQLKRSIDAFNRVRTFNKSKDIIPFNSFSIKDENIINPARWGR